MISYKDYLDQEIANKNDEVGTVLSFDKDHLLIKYRGQEKTYSPEIAIKSGFITFKDKTLQELIQKEFQEQEETQKKKREESLLKSEEHLAFVREINKTYEKLLKKSEFLRKTFGSDFKYPPLVEFEKKHQQILDKRKKHGCFKIEHSYRDDYISDPFWH